MTTLRPDVYEFGDFRLDAAKRLLSRRTGGMVPLTARVFDTLLYLVQNSGTVLDKRSLMEAIWPDSIVEENNLNQSISSLRRSLGESPASHRYIVTVPGRGYRFVAEVKAPPALPSSSSSARIRSVAVLPFKPLVLENRDAFLEMGMADTMIAKLSGIRDVVVRPLSSVRKYVDLEQEPLAAGRELGVESVLDGSIQKSGDAIRVTARLMNVTNGESIWSGTFNEKFTGIFAVQDAISERIVSALALRLSGEEKARLTKRDTKNTEAYRLYLKGRYYWWKTTPDSFAKSCDYFQRAVEADPFFALGYCGLNSYYGFGSAWGMLPPDENWPKAEAAITKALHLDDTLAQAHTGLAAHRLVCRRDWNGAEQAVKQAIELDPSFDEAHYLYSFYLLVMQRVDEAIAEGEHALELDPFSLRIYQHLGNIHYHARRYDEAIVHYRQALELEPSNAQVHESLGDALERNGLPDDAVAQWEKGLTLAGDNELAAVLGRSHNDGGFTRAVRAVAKTRLERLKARTERGNHVLAIDYARAYVRLGDKKHALHWLLKACDECNVFALLIAIDPFYDRLRKDVRFTAIRKKVGLPKSLN
jgi:DNA-binding winged helix-turn-helix (wHTH) protein/Tfp pilus assembly protein PilF